VVTTLKQDDPPSHFCLSEQEFLKATNTKCIYYPLFVLSPDVLVVKEVIAYNISNSTSPIAVVREDWVLDSVANRKLLDEVAYMHGKKATTVSSTPILPTSSTASTQSKKSRGAKRKRAPSEDKV